MPPKRSNLGRHHYETQRKRVVRSDHVINNNVIIWRRAAFAYNWLKRYFSNAKVSIGEMLKICQYCNAKKVAF